MQSETNIALFLPSLSGGGAERVFVQLAGMFAARGLSIDLIVANSNGPWLSQLSKDVRLIDLEKPKPSSAIWRLIKYLRRARPQALMSALTHANITLAIAYCLSGIPGRCVLSERASVVALAEEKSRWDYYLTKILCFVVYRWAHSVVAVSHAVAQELTENLKIPKDYISVIYNPIEQAKICALGRQPIKFPWNDHFPVIIAIGRLHKQKNYRDLVRAFAQLQSVKPSRLVILGEGDERASLEQLINDLDVADKVWMPGFVDNPYAYLARSELMVLSSSWEGLPNVLLESLALNVPIVSTDCPSGPKEILGVGRYGKLVPIGDSTALTDAMKRSLDGEHPRFDLGEALSPYLPEIIVNQYLQLFGIQFLRSNIHANLSAGD